jgi:diguanylate cyclase (GGDEF)-like protein
MPILGEVDYIRQEGIAESEAYMDILKELQKYKEAFGFTFVYLIENGPENFTFLLDTDKLGEDADMTFLTDYNEMAEFLSSVVKNRQIEITNIYTDRFGTFMTAFVPVVRQDKVVSIIGLDYEISLVRSLQRRSLLQVVFILIITITFVLIMAMVISMRFTSLVKETDILNKQLLSANGILEALSTIDELTKLNNRRSFLNYTDIIWKQNHRLNLPVTVLMIDVDFFKKYNDSLGHLEGDKALIAIAQCMKNHIKRETDFVARFGGEEFVCLLPFVKNDEALEFAKTLVANVENMKIPHPVSEHSKYLTISVGMASVVPGDNNSYIQLLNEADKALYAAKKSGRNRVVVNLEYNAESFSSEDL